MRKSSGALVALCATVRLVLSLPFCAFATPPVEDVVPPAAGLKKTDAYTLEAERNLLTDYEPMNPDGNINVVIEIPTGTIAKWEVDKESGGLKWELKKGKPRRVGYLGYPGNYGMIPKTRYSKEMGGDGDPLDVIVLGPPLPRGSVVAARTIGVLKSLDGGERDDKLIAVLPGTPLSEATSMKKLQEDFKGAAEILRIWFSNYKGPGRVKTEGFGDAEEARRILAAASEAFSHAESGKRVLLVFSYHPAYAWVKEETRGVEEVFRESGLRIEKFYMDTKRKTSLEWKREIAGAAARKIESFRPDLVIVFDDNACKYVAKRYIGNDLPIVFCGMNGDPEEYGFPSANITGVVERVRWKESMELLKKLAPRVEKVAIVADESTSSLNSIARLRKKDLPLEIVQAFTTNDFDAWRSEIRDLQRKVDALGILAYFTIRKEEGGESMEPEEVLRWTLANSRLPEFGLQDFAVKDGALCGVVESGYYQGKRAAGIALRILNGEKPSDIPISGGEKGVPLVNARRAGELHIGISEGVRKEALVVH